jgi:thiamine monophosphate synthase
LADAARLSGVPVLAIGGIDAARLREVARFASGVAAIGWFATTDARRLAAAVQQVHSAFDTVKPLI